jgi:ferredoxin
MIRRLLSDDINAAVKIIRHNLPLPATLGHICSAPCQKGCRRASLDKSVSIRQIHKAIATYDIDNAASTHDKNPQITAKSKHIAIIGSGPAGLSSAYFLANAGYQCKLFESQPQIGGSLRSQFDESTLPKKILDADIESIAKMGVTFITGKKIFSIDDIYNDYDAIIVTTGLPDSNQRPFNLEHDSHGIKICHDTFAASRPKVFACGSAVRPITLAARSAGQGKSLSMAVDSYLSGDEPMRKPFSMSTGHLSTAEINSLGSSIPHTNNQKLSTALSSRNPKISNPADTVNTANAIDTSDVIDIIIDSARCLACDCVKKDSCKLKDYATQYAAHHLRYATGRRKRYTRQTYASGLIHEPGKCIACGKCVSITAQRNITPGLALTGRGADVCVSAPFGTPIDKAMGDALTDCVAACPTGALSLRP